MNPLKKLAGQTAIYGLSTIVGRLLNYFLVPLYTHFFLPAEYGVVTEIYAYVAFLVVLLTFGMETTFFRKYNQSENKEHTYRQSFLIVSVINGGFLTLALIFSSSIAAWMLYPDHPEYIIWLAFIVVFDALSAIPLAKLRAENKAKKFAFVQLASIGTNIILNLFFIAYLKNMYDTHGSDFFLSGVYNPALGVGYIFIANLFSSLIKPVLLIRDLPNPLKLKVDRKLIKQMFIYALPLVIAGFAGIINETLDRILLKRLLYSQGEEYAMTQVGIYGACYKLSILITIFIQAFRYAAEPFFFSEAKGKNHKRIYSKVMTYFVITVTTIFLMVTLYIDVFKWFIPQQAYWEGLKVVPILLLANICLGIYYNQSIWYKLSDNTRYGALIAIIGACITLLFNYILIPRIGYMGAAWTTLICYASMMILSYYFGQKFYPIHYNLRKIIFYLVTAVVFYRLGLMLTFDHLALTLLVHSLILLAFIWIAYTIEKPLKNKEAAR